MLADVLSTSREQYVWKAESAKESQENVVRLELETARRIADLNGANAQWIALKVSRWGGNRATRKVASWSSGQKSRVAELIKRLLIPASLKEALRELTEQPGLSLVMASKIYRFCCPQFGAAVDQHSSYFFNSLPALDESAKLIGVCTRFKREWSSGEHRQSRLATYTSLNCDLNLSEFCDTYIPRLTEIAQALNSKRSGFLCAASGATRLWRPTDVEMAAYMWWSRNAGQRS